MRYFKSYKAYRKAWDDAYKVTPEIPLNIDIELSSRCNLNCNYCPINSTKYQEKVNWANRPWNFPVNFLFDLLGECIDLGVPAVKLNWLGEPTLHPDFSLILTEIGRLDFYDVLMNTSGNYRSTLTWSLLNLTKIKFSVDTFDKENYRRMKRGGNLEDVIDNINSLLSNGHPCVGIHRTITNDNEFEDFKGQAKACFGDKVIITEHWEFDRTISARSQEKIDLNRRYCGYPSQRLVVNTNGDVFPCCADMFGEMNLGNIKFNSLMSIWNSEKLQRIRDLLKKGEFPSQACKECVSWVAYKSPKAELVKDKALWKKPSIGKLSY